MALIYICPVTNDVELLFMWLFAIYTCSLMKFLFKCFVHLIIELFVFLFLIIYIYIICRDIDMFFANIFSQSITHLFLFSTVCFKTQNFSASHLRNVSHWSSAGGLLRSTKAANTQQEKAWVSPAQESSCLQLTDISQCYRHHNENSPVGVTLILSPLYWMYYS